MIARSLLMVLPPLMIGLVALFLVWPGPLRRQVLLKVSLGVGAGLGIDSCLYFAWSMLFHPAQKGFLLIEGLALIGLLAAVVWLRIRPGLQKPRSSLQTNRPGVPGLLLAAVFAGALGLSAAVFAAYTFMQPLGTYDAFGIWNLRARLILTNAANWKIAFSPILYWNIHPDYPLLLTANVTRLWALLGQLTPRAPVVLAGLFTFSLALLLFSTVSQLKDMGQGALAGLVLLGTPALLLLGGSQTAEIPLAYYLLASAALLLLYGRSRRPAFLALAGLMAGFAAWTKNEGLLYLAALVAALVVAALLENRKDGMATGISFWQPSRLFRSLKILWPFGLGLLPPLITLLAFKLTLAPTNDLFAGQTLPGILAKLVDLSRYRTILAALGPNLWDFGEWRFPILPVLLVAGILLFRRVRHDDRWGLGVVLLSTCLTLLGYFGVYLITPHPLKWHLTYSLDRLLFHFFPVGLMVLFLVSQSIEEAIHRLSRKGRVESEEQ